jgi:hypothetical protein
MLLIKQKNMPMKIQQFSELNQKLLPAMKLMLIRKAFPVKEK